MRSMQQQLGNVGTISAFACRVVILIKIEIHCIFWFYSQRVSVSALQQAVCNQFSRYHVSVHNRQTPVMCGHSTANSAFGKCINLCNTNWPTTWQILQQFQDTDLYSAMSTSVHIESKFLVDTAIALQVDASDNAFDTYTGSVHFESLPRINCPMIFLVFLSVPAETLQYLLLHEANIYFYRKMNNLLSTKQRNLDNIQGAPKSRDTLY